LNYTIGFKWIDNQLFIVFAGHFYASGYPSWANIGHRTVNVGTVLTLV